MHTSQQPCVCPAPGPRPPLTPWALLGPRTHLCKQTLSFSLDKMSWDGGEGGGNVTQTLGLSPSSQFYLGPKNLHV